MPLIEYINQKFSGNQAEFARRMDVDAQAVRKWVKAGWIVVDDKLYSPRRDIPQDGAN